MKSFHLDTGRTGPLMVRQVPTPRMTDSGAPQVDDNGEVVNLGRVIVPGVLTSSYGTPAPRQCRLKVTGQVPDGITDGSVVRLAGKVTVTSWYLRGARGRDARSEITLSPERVELAPGEFPTFEGLLPVRPPVDDAFTFMASKPAEGGNGFEAALVVPSSIVDQAGTVRVVLDVQPDEGLAGRPVRFEGLRVALLQPEGEDVGRASKAGFLIYAERLVPAEPAAAAASARGRRQEPETEVLNTDSADG
ncbi:MAG: hypothetical protein GEV08_21095 [Acidimicrobiia bacterium]|nr:hypothetical protein [Acidimicrobiia bacterium]